MLFPRSSICKTDLRQANAVGVIDSDYRGPIRFVFDKFTSCDGDEPRLYQHGNRCGQLVIVPVPEVSLLEVVDELSETSRDTCFTLWGTFY